MSAPYQSSRSAERTTTKRFLSAFLKALLTSMPCESESGTVVSAFSCDRKEINGHRRDRSSISKDSFSYLSPLVLLNSLVRCHPVNHIVSSSTKTQDTYIHPLLTVGFLPIPPYMTRCVVHRSYSLASHE